MLAHTSSEGVVLEVRPSYSSLRAGPNPKLPNPETLLDSGFRVHGLEIGLGVKTEGLEHTLNPEPESERLKS